MRVSGRRGHGFVFQPKRIASSQTVERSVGEEGQLEDKEIDGNLNNKTIIKIHPPPPDTNPFRGLRPKGNPPCSNSHACLFSELDSRTQYCHHNKGLPTAGRDWLSQSSKKRCWYDSVMLLFVPSALIHFETSWRILMKLLECRTTADDARTVLLTLCRRKWQLVHCANLWGGSFPFYEAEEVCLATKDTNSTRKSIRISLTDWSL